jgi:hypothetical protein
VFVTVFAASLLLTAGSVGAVLSGGVAVAVPEPSDGEFVVSFDRLEGEEFTTHPTVRSSETCDEQPYVVTEIQEGTIHDLKISREIVSPFPGDGTIRVNIEAEKAEFTGLTQVYTSQTGNLTFDDGQRIDSEPGVNVDDRFQINADSVRIEDGVLVSEGQVIDQLSLTESSVTMETNPEDSLPTDSGPKCLEDQ